MSTFVYVISGDHGRQKIGISDSPGRRISELQTGSPYPLKFEFVGQVANNGAGAVEVEAHFMLNRHKAPGGDEWFVVPPDVAVTAVMAAAHRLGYRIKPVDPDAAADQVEYGTPPWHHWTTAVAAIPLLAITWWMLASFDSGRIGGVSVVVCTAVLLGGFQLLRRSLIQVVNTIQWVRAPMLRDDP